MSGLDMDNSTRAIRYQTIEQKRAALHRALLTHPGDKRLQEHLERLSTPQQIRRASRDGIFISYSRADELFAINLATDLEAAGQQVWMDMLHITYEGDWRQEVHAALRRCGLMLMIVSRTALQDRDLRFERKYFIQKGKIILPVIYKPDQPIPNYYLPPVDFSYSHTLGMQSLVRILGAGRADS